MTEKKNLPWNKKLQFDSVILHPGWNLPYGRIEDANFGPMKAK